MQEAPRPPPPSSVFSYAKAAFNAQSEAEYARLRNAVRDEQIRVSNSVRVDMAAVLDECLAVRAAVDAEVNRGIRVSRFEVLQRTLARLKDFEGELLLATAPEGHMEPEWSAQV